MNAASAASLDGICGCLDFTIGASHTATTVYDRMCGVLDKACGHFLDIIHELHRVYQARHQRFYIGAEMIELIKLCGGILAEMFRSRAALQFSPVITEEYLPSSSRRTSPPLRTPRRVATHRIPFLFTEFQQAGQRSTMCSSVLDSPRVNQRLISRPRTSRQTPVHQKHNGHETGRSVTDGFSRTAGRSIRRLFTAEVVAGNV